MDWFLIIILLSSLWAASLCIAIYACCFPPKDAFLCNGEVACKKNVLLVIAHPDDESMFFLPVIFYLTSKGHNLHLLCMSTGNADGKGNMRKEELYQACAVLKVPLQHVKILDHLDLQDGFDKIWSHKLLANIVKEEISSQSIDLIITFDYYGVSGHKNHRDVHHGVRMALYENSQTNIEAWELISTNIMRKYSGPVDIWLSILCAFFYPRGEMFCLLNQYPNKSFLAMAQHRSQWVWFRKLFVSLSSYTYVNTLRKISI
ncbi:N-acetylglucosaminyl-phosphatidylinositol de-N-acetylase-like isoform X2 [Macadamia integrifolia]|uniref:N-acetylglucosaminyl-phosphatidylinositol de-N-acetylase-like isoform X2 n=1 Tax=Macadamia integrifolia TaxID=60698 RepID=UPI001C4E8386|nr:N-acetylglucosaminyl-phosphatidylinositol de-N-acetylase-like isoform X2 [Macadamia integrifolia]XP_042503550.1 N-acetylglucosaminyl-phosphatidylinositol de-N-acetylase-like isoform X2 [Macadamia integrifolia]XP_042503551.1 N-acetylglucosaminyl-phosphatidylinositol de-N-acetylase-like isoform X2 [Macadamia integrifolia]XP_042503552.1 N-acetylglucosaminyl-phosphatidylinositol de-N-acetylase-like isoform X2 [Macadamia integrifolia]